MCLTTIAIFEGSSDVETEPVKGAVAKDFEPSAVPKLRDERNVALATPVRSIVLLRIVLRKNRVVSYQVFQLPNVRTVRSDPAVLDVHTREIDAAIAGAFGLPFVYTEPVSFDSVHDHGLELLGELIATKAEATVVAVTGVGDRSERRRKPVGAVRGVDEPSVDMRRVKQLFAPREEEFHLFDSRILDICSRCVAEGFVELTEHDVEEVRRDAGSLLELSTEGEHSARHPRKVLPDAVVDEKSGNPVRRDAAKRICDIHAEATSAVPMMPRVGHDGTLIPVCRRRKVWAHHSAERKVKRATENREREVVLQPSQVLARRKTDAFVALLAVPNVSRPLVHRIPKNLLEQRDVNGFLLTSDAGFGIPSDGGVQPTKFLERKGKALFDSVISAWLGKLPGREHARHGSLLVVK